MKSVTYDGFFMRTIRAALMKYLAEAENAVGSPVGLFCKSVQ